jgi:hypothetical protein
MNLVRKKKPRPLCACGCLRPTNYHRGKYNTWLVGHSSTRKRKKREFKLIPCACGCDTKLITPTSYGKPIRYVIGHHRKGKPSANKGIHFSEEWRRNMSMALINSWKRRKNKKLS